MKTSLRCGRLVNAGDGRCSSFQVLACSCVCLVYFDVACRHDCQLVRRTLKHPPHAFCHCRSFAMRRWNCFSRFLSFESDRCAPPGFNGDRSHLIDAASRFRINRRSNRRPVCDRVETNNGSRTFLVSSKQGTTDATRFCFLCILFCLVSMRYSDM